MNAPTVARIEAATEDFYALLPAHVRTVDAAGGYRLKALIAILAGGAAELDGEIDTLLDSLFVDTAPEAALADFAALVGAAPLSLLPEGAGHNQRAYIANTLHYRRGNGTARILEELAADVGGFGAVAVEYFMRLVRTQHLLDVRLERPGTAYPVAGETAARTGTGFDRLPRLVDFRSIARAAGRHDIKAVGVHLLRPIVPAFPAPSRASPPAPIPQADLAGVPVARPWLDGTTVLPGYFQLAAQPDFKLAGRPAGTLRLFNPDRRAEGGEGRVIETDLRDRLRRLPLHLETEELRRASLEAREPDLGETPWFDEAGQPFTIFVRETGATTFTRVPPEQIQIANLESMPVPPGARPAANKAYSWFTGATPQPISHSATHPIRCGFDPVTGRLIIAPPVGPAPEVDEVRIAYAYGIGREIGAGPQDRNGDEVPFDIIDTDDVRHFVRIVDSSALAAVGTSTAWLRTVNTLTQALADWNANGAPGASDRDVRGVIALVRCDREKPLSPAPNFQVPTFPRTELHIVSGQWRPKLTGPGIVGVAARHGYLVRKDRRFTVDGKIGVFAGAVPPAGFLAGALILDGLEITGGVALSVKSVSALTVRHCTLRAPGTAALDTTAALDQAEIAIHRSIVGRIRLDPGSAAGTGSLTIRDSIVAADGHGGEAIAAAPIDARLDNVTAFGPTRFKSLEATNVIFANPVTTTRNQDGCVRYSSIAAGSKTPRRYRCQPDLAIEAATKRKGKNAVLTPAERDSAALGATPIFLDTTLDEPTVAMLHPLTSNAIGRGGEGECEIGVFAEPAERIRMGNIESLFDDYVPFGLEAGLIDDTRSSAVAKRRNRP